MLQAPTRLYIGLDYIPPDLYGVNSVADALKIRPPDLPHALRWSIQFCVGMEHAYARGVRSHRDIKPENILLSGWNTVKISDFGIASAVGGEGVAISASEAVKGGAGEPELTGTGEVFGSLAYMSPEQLDDATLCDERTDIYAFGIVLYQMLSYGKYPYAFDVLPGENPVAWARRVHKGSDPAPIDSPLWAIVRGCLAKKPT